MKNILSGSVKSLISPEDENDRDKKLLELFDDLFLQVFSLQSQKEMYTLKPPRNGFEHHWFINAKTRMMENFPISTYVELIEEYDEDSYLCHANGRDIIIKKDILNEKVDH